MQLKDIRVKRTSTKYNITTKEAAEILKAYGLASSEQSIWRYIDKEYIKAQEPSNPNDKRTGYRLSGAGLYSFIAKRLPAVKLLWDELDRLEKESKKK